MSHYHQCDLDACGEWGYQPPAVTLADAIDMLPKSNVELRVWMRDHGLGNSPSIDAVMSAVRADLRKIAGGEGRG